MIHARMVLGLALAALVVAQGLKFIIWSIKEKQFTWYALFSTGSMPSSHSAFVTALTVSIFLYEKTMNSYYFVLSLALALVVIHDSMGIRLEASKHAQILNRMLRELSLDQQKQLGFEKELKEPLGHIPVEVFAGIVLGFMIAVAGYLIF